jgi:thymidylate kinase
VVLIALEGIDGAGKTTVLPKIADRIRKRYPNRNVIEAGEFGSVLGPILRRNLGTLDITEKILWFASDRASIWASIYSSAESGSIRSFGSGV